MLGLVIFLFKCFFNTITLTSILDVFLLSKKTTAPNRLLLSDKSNINSPTVAKEMSDLGVAEKPRFTKLQRASRPGTAYACFLCSFCYSDFKSIAF